ncbi:plastoglobulin-1, chloroplastic-like [Dorcoceras hygrometricum]|uniref:Plastoglobulin-1, chloroplastic-like n=1 Tax=Dorcoceras hygrometricum TaxID=472368 RepID=A0A2Z7D1N4_9LAMI|nr:plastoglobulin-1, chloroplastic-like [Dorcoceras hygrometricum]
MSLLLNSHPSLLSNLFPKFILNSPKPSSSICFAPKIKSKFPTRSSYNFSSYDPTDPPSKPDVSAGSGPENPSVVDEWGEKSGPEPEPTSKIFGTDPPIDDDEWGGSAASSGNGSPAVNDGTGGNGVEDERLRDLKRALVDTVYGSEFGFRVSSEVRAETLELVSQLEAANPNPSPVECPELLGGNWVLVFTAFSELVPLLAANSIPFVKVEKIGQSIDTRGLTIENSTTFSTPTSNLSFSALASFEIQSPSRIQEGSLNPPEIKSTVDLPESINIFGQNINISFVQQFLNPLQNAVAGIARAISGQSPLKIPIRGGQTKSWLLTTYLDKEFRISRGDGGLFVLVKEGSPLLDW